MTCTPHLRAAGAVAASATLLAAAMTATTPTLARAQTTPVPPTPATVAPYRAPVLALVQPPPGGALTVPQDRPVVVFRFAQGEPLDPIDAASFRVAVDGHDRTAQFQVAAAEAWGPLGDAGAAAGAAGALAAGPHQVAARVCSSRGACAAVDVAVTALPTAAVEAAPAIAKTSRRSRVIALLLQASKQLLAP
ncbi:MAG TPA: hypothetical protein VFJ74_01325 [Gemmatimonadaceae bacterium]|nr:hypothetical protein [Gemmatimonadaceae bacterium]